MVGGEDGVGRPALRHERRRPRVRSERIGVDATPRNRPTAASVSSSASSHTSEQAGVVHLRGRTNGELLRGGLVR